MCNSGASHVDLVAALLARVFPPANSELDRNELKKIFQSIANDIPGLLNELKVNRGSEKIALAGLREKVQNLKEFRVLNIGPIQREYLKIFSLKFALAAHFEATGKIVPLNGFVVGEIKTNFDAVTNGSYLDIAENF